VEVIPTRGFGHGSRKRLPSIRPWLRHREPDMTVPSAEPQLRRQAEGVGSARPNSFCIAVQSAATSIGNCRVSSPGVVTSQASDRSLLDNAVDKAPAAERYRSENGLDKGGEGRNRTGDTTVFSRVLYRLSYLALL
jgi:hypothetical protein